MRRLLEAHIASEHIKTIFFTHLHADHDLGLADVMSNDFFRLNSAGSRQTVAVYGPPQTKGLVDAAFRYVTFGFTTFAAEPGATRAGLVNGELRNPFVAHEIQQDGPVYRDEKIRVIAAENTHYALMPAKSRKQMKSYSYRIETPHGVIVFTGDTGPSDAVTQLAKGADVLITEVEDLGQVTKFVNGFAEQNHWSAERTSDLMAHMRQEHINETEVGEMATKAAGQVSGPLSLRPCRSGSPRSQSERAFFRPGVRFRRSGSLLRWSTEWKIERQQLRYKPV